MPHEDRDEDQDQDQDQDISNDDEYEDIGPDYTSPTKTAEQLASNNPALQQLVYGLGARNMDAHSLTKEEMNIFRVRLPDGTSICALCAGNSKPYKDSPARPKRLKDHINKHLNIKSYSCELDGCKCGGKMFFSSAQKNTHEKSSDPELCELCNKKVVKKNLSRHTRTQGCREAAAAQKGTN
ncbi:hypothetical protein FRC15_001608 [Serendipita sp. 397]|nr:hypothetical protein FRC15_001608 [Serendipita sp. 397]KAG8781187.1 hypothetical protein FRC16_002920 [Serendipita sp. 398]